MTNTTGNDEVILKSDAAGRVRTPAARREQMLDEFERSGASGKQFAELAGVKYQTFATWVQKRRRSAKLLEAAPARTQWLEAVMAKQPESSAPLLLRLPGGAQAELSNVNQIPMAAELLRALSRPC